MKPVLLLIIFSFIIIITKGQMFLPTDTIKVVYKGEKVNEFDNSMPKGKSYNLICSYYPQYKSKSIFITKVINFPFFEQSFDEEQVSKDSVFIVILDSVKFYGLPITFNNNINKLKRKQISEKEFKKLLGYCFLNLESKDDILKFNAGESFRTTQRINKDSYIISDKDKSNRSGNEFSFKRNIGIDEFMYWFGYGNSYKIIFRKL